MDLGCGFGWHCQYAVEQGAKAVTGVVEPQPSEHLLHTVSGMEDELRRPMIANYFSEEKITYIIKLQRHRDEKS